MFFPWFQFPGHTKPDVYLIDIDGNGRFPPAHVRCEFPSIEESTKTIVEHNLPSQMDVRSPSEQDFRYLSLIRLSTVMTRSIFERVKLVSPLSIVSTKIRRVNQENTVVEKSPLMTEQ